MILSDIEKRIKEKIEKAGKPLKDWGVNIYKGVLTGCNEAFIIDKVKRDELIAKDKKSAEIIRLFYAAGIFMALVKFNIVWVSV